MIRSGEIESGVEVRDQLGDSHGQSVAAAKEGLAKCSLARLVKLNIPTMRLYTICCFALNLMAFKDC